MSLRGEVCVVTGACGFLGQTLVRLLLDEEDMAEVRLLDKLVQPQLLQNLEGKNRPSTLLFTLNIKYIKSTRRILCSSTLLHVFPFFFTKH